MVSRLAIIVAALCLSSGAIVRAGGGASPSTHLCAFGQQFKVTLYSCLADETAKSQYLLLNSWEGPTRAAAEYHVRYGGEAWWVDDLQNLRAWATLKKIGLAANSTNAEKAVGRETALRLYACIQSATFASPFDTDSDTTYEAALMAGPAALYLVERLKVPPIDLVNAMRAAESRLLPDLQAFRPGRGSSDALSPAVWRVFGESCTEGDAITAAQILAHLAHDRLKIAK